MKSEYIALWPQQLEYVGPATTAAWKKDGPPSPLFSAAHCRTGASRPHQLDSSGIQGLASKDEYVHRQTKWVRGATWLFQGPHARE